MQGRIRKYAGGGSCTTSLAKARSVEEEDWFSKTYDSGGNCMFAAAVVTRPDCRHDGTGYYYVNGYRAYARPVLGEIPDGISHQASWYLLFEQGRGYETAQYDRPYYLHDNVSGLNVNVPHVAYVEEMGEEGGGRGGQLSVQGPDGEREPGAVRAGSERWVYCSGRIRSL